MEIFITGATGFVGSSLARVLGGEGALIRALVRPGADRSRLAGVNVSWIEGDVTDPKSLQGTFTGADWVIHAAGMLGKVGAPDSAYHQLHVDGTRNVLNELIRQDDLPRILYISSPGVLGPIEGAPADEMAVLRPSNAYERSKASAERVAQQFAGRGLPVVIARPEFIYGPGDLHVLGLFQAVQRGLFFYIGEGNCFCHPTFIDDAVDGMIRCLRLGRSGEIYHITGPRPVSFRELGETLAAALQVKPPWLRVPRTLAWLAGYGLELLGSMSGKTPPLSRTGVAFFSESRAFDWNKARQELGYEPKSSLASGVERTVSWYRQKNHLR